MSIFALRSEFKPLAIKDNSTKNSPNLARLLILIWAFRKNNIRGRNKKVNILFEEEINKFLWSDVSSNIDGYEFGFIPLMIALIKIKKHIDLLPQRIKKEELRDTRLSKFQKLPIEVQRKELISEQEKILDFLELKNSFIMNLIKKRNLKKMTLSLNLLLTETGRI